MVFQLQVDPDVFAALPKDLQEELKSAYNRETHVQAQAKICTLSGDSTEKKLVTDLGMFQKTLKVRYYAHLTPMIIIFHP